ncbi:hypothetical protein SAMN06265795_103266 [Noviherbaspirillum humi]|uniref:Uncharacterized protein n=1 Tax=Noviherbaspirillum humi TaxID=1688639 RepID=A0A239FAC1_9BURK|nr:hypothetical protein SAMN06265795_103266 [Noviherbaspirillum humi]
MHHNEAARCHFHKIYSPYSRAALAKAARRPNVRFPFIVFPLAVAGIHKPSASL